jgi:MFS family permease
MRKVLAVIAAFFGGGVVVMLVQALGHSIYPPPADQSLPSLNEYMKTAPVGALAFVLGAQSAGSLVGGLIAGLIGKSNLPIMIYAVLALIMAALNAFLISHPIWFTALSLILPIPLAFIGGRMAMGFGSKEA